MRSEKAWYWLAAGVVALGLNGAYQDGQFGRAHFLADRASAVIERASERSLHFVTMAEILLGRSPASFDRAGGALQRIHGKLVCERVSRAQRQMAMAQVREQLVEANLQRKLGLAQMKMDKVRMVAIDRANRFRSCSGLSKVVIDMPELPNVDLSNLPDIHIPDVPAVGVMSESHTNGPI
jgi:hypothetical protein